MKNIRQPEQNEKGMALPVILVVLLVAGLLIATSLSFASTTLLSIRSEQKNVKGLYAADAGIEDVLWSLKKVQATRTALPQSMNGLNVTMLTVPKGAFTFYQGECVSGSGGGHSNYVLISSTIVWDAGANAYKYTVTLTRSASATGNINLSNVGALLPPGYIYKPGSAGSFPGNLSLAAPTDTLNSAGAHKVNWSISPTKNLGSTPLTETFYFTGTDVLDSYYAWAAATRADVGGVSELSGYFYQITATAKQGTTTVASVTADVMKSGSILKIISWRIK